jgi:superfamily I DNA/RNA helicase
MRICAAIDYDEQILLACDLLRREPAVLEKYRKASTHLLVDEYQDINSAQHELIRLLSQGNLSGLFVVGDDDQSIYSWRGGSPEYIRNFAACFGENAQIVPLLHSFRCHKNVLEGSFGVVEKHDPQRLPKGQFTYRQEEGPKIAIHSTPTDEKEAREVRKIIQRVLPAQDVLVLFPNRQFSAAIMKELRSAKIPFTAPAVIPGAGLPLISKLADWISNPTDSLSLRRVLDSVIESPALGIPSHRARKPEKKEEREAALHQVARLWESILEGRTGSLWEAIAQVRDSSDLLRKVHAALQELLDNAGDGTSLEQVLASIAKHLHPWRKSADFLSEAGSWVEAFSYTNQMSQRASVRLMTFQTAKGLEAKVVCVIGLEDGIIPREGPEVDKAEQARLLFVSMTRAKNELHLFHARKRSSYVVQRSIYGTGSQPDLSRSTFLNAIDKQFLDPVYHRY